MPNGPNALPIPTSTTTLTTMTTMTTNKRPLNDENAAMVEPRYRRSADKPTTSVAALTAGVIHHHIMTPQQSAQESKANGSSAHHDSPTSTSKRRSLPGNARPTTSTKLPVNATDVLLPRRRRILGELSAAEVQARSSCLFVASDQTALSLASAGDENDDGRCTLAASGKANKIALRRARQALLGLRHTPRERSLPVAFLPERREVPPSDVEAVKPSVAPRRSQRQSLR